jgi:hypothetical protein
MKSSPATDAGALCATVHINKSYYMSRKSPCCNMIEQKMEVQSDLFRSTSADATPHFGDHAGSKAQHQTNFTEFVKNISYDKDTHAF